MSRLLAHWTPGQWVLRVVCVGGVLVALGATGLSGAWPAWWLVLLVGGLAVGHAVAPDGPMGTVAMGLVLVWWGVAFRDGLHPGALVAATGLVASHVAGLVASYGPERMAVDPATVRLWVRRAAQVLLLPPGLFLVALLVRGRPDPGGIWVAGMTAALAGVLALGLVAGPAGAEER